MFLVSGIIDNIIKLRLKNESFRASVFRKAIGRELRHSKLGLVILRNLNEKMNVEPELHQEFMLVAGKDEFQRKFWESDLGYLWFTGNVNVSKPYFNFTLDLIVREKIDSVLDIGCGWGVFCNMCAERTHASVIHGIDVGELVIEHANRMRRDTRVRFEKRDFFDIKLSYDLIAIFGSIDYVLPEEIEPFIRRIIQLSNKKSIIVNSLRKMQIDEYIELKVPVEILRYDIGYVHSVNFILQKLKSEFNFNYSIEKSGLDSAMTIISK
jgi:2-polyprenyl-3-methyl-5-hydroxy-6-metoxy-1,4-benzoquinol methylase